MKRHLYIYAVLIVLFIAYNLFFRVQDERLDTAINILGASVIFGYIAWMALSLIRIMKNKR